MGVGPELQAIVAKREDINNPVLRIQLMIHFIVCYLLHRFALKL
jgi:hypothetical protein